MYGTSNSQNVGSHGGSLKSTAGHQYNLLGGLARLGMSPAGSWQGWSCA
jgi:hypothetical protein